MSIADLPAAPPVLPSAVTSAPFEHLRARMTGEVVTPGEAGWDDARQAWNLAVDQRPAAVALPESAADVVAAVEFAAEHGLRVAPQGTGHNAHPLVDLETTVLLRTSRMCGVEIDPYTMTARAEAGALWMDVTTPAAEYGLAALAGSSPDVGVVGYTLGGGVSWLARRYGLAANSVIAVELVLADGRHVRATRHEHADLFWAVRGGGGSFGVVTAIEFLLYPIASVHAGAMFWPVERAGEVLRAWRDWTETVPEEVTSIGRVLQFPPIPDIPEPFRGRSFVVVEATCLVDDEAAEALLAPLRALGPEMDTFGRLPVQGLSRLHMDPEHPVPAKGDHALLGELTDEAIDAMIATVVGAPLIGAAIRHLGGAVGRRAPHHGALSAIDAPFALFAVGMVMDEAMGAAVVASLEAMRTALAPWDTGVAYMNFAERVTDAAQMVPETTYRRLRRLRADVDPAELIQSNHPIPAAD